MKNQTGTAIYQVEGMHCASCVNRVEKALQAVLGVSVVQVNLNAKRVNLEFAEHPVPVEDLKKAVASVGFELRDQQSSTTQERTASDRELKWRVIIASPLAAIIFCLSMFVSDFPYKNVLLAILASPVVLWSGRPIFLGAIKSLKHWAFNMDTLIAIGSGTAFVVSLSAIFFPQIWSGQPPVYFDAASVTIFFVLTGRFLEERAKRKTASAIDALIDLQPQTAMLWKNGEETEVSIEELDLDNLIRIRPGERIPIDGQVYEGTGSVDESMVTGESVPVEKKENDSVIGGTLNLTGGLIVRVTKVGTNTVLHQIMELVSSAQSSKAPIARLADKVASIFVPAVMGIALLTFITWCFIDPSADGISHAVLAAVTVLVISCPCALGLATPTAMSTAMGRAAELGLMVKDAETLEEAARIQQIVFDKTGTLTEGKLSVSKIHTLGSKPEQEFLQLAAAVEQHSEHPLATAILKENSKRQPEKLGEDLGATFGLQLLETRINDSPQVRNATEFQNFAGQGAQANVGGDFIFVGNNQFLTEHGPREQLPNQFLKDTAASLVYVFSKNELFGVIEVLDNLKEDAKETVAELQRMGFEVTLISGDRHKTVEAMSAAVGIKKFQAEVLPEEKAKEVESLRTSDQKVAMVGDGINDAPALAAADLGIAMSSGTDVAIAAAGMTVLSDQVMPVADGFRLACRTMTIIKQNLFFAFVYNLIGIPFAAGVFYPWTGWLLPPMFAAAAMSISSISVVLNSLRLRK